MMIRRPVGFVLFLLFATIVTTATGGNTGRGAAPLRAWDGIITTTLFADIADFNRDLQQTASERMYTFLVLDEKGGVALSVVVAIAPAGSRLPPMEWQASFTAADSTTRARYFPSIGARARAMEPRFSPDGALNSLTFATSDGFFDVSVSVFEASSKAKRPPLTAEDAARRINAAYEATRE